jgi:hypothetical protein
MSGPVFRYALKFLKNAGPLAQKAKDKVILPLGKKSIELLNSPKVTAFVNALALKDFIWNLKDLADSHIAPLVGKLSTERQQRYGALMNKVNAEKQLTAPESEELGGLFGEAFGKFISQQSKSNIAMFVKQDSIVQSINGVEVVVGRIERITMATYEDVSFLKQAKLEEIKASQIHAQAQAMHQAVGIAATLMQKAGVPPMAVKTFSIVASVGINVSTILRLATSSANPIMLGINLISAILPIFSIFDDDVDEERHRQVMETLHQIREDIYKMHKDMIECFDNLNKQINHVSTQIAQGFFTTSIKLQRIEEGLDKLIARNYALAADIRREFEEVRGELLKMRSEQIRSGVEPNENKFTTALNGLQQSCDYGYFNTLYTYFNDTSKSPSYTGKNFSSEDFLRLLHSYASGHSSYDYAILCDSQPYLLLNYADIDLRDINYNTALFKKLRLSEKDLPNLHAYCRGIWAFIDQDIHWRSKDMGEQAEKNKERIAQLPEQIKQVIHSYNLLGDVNLAKNKIAAYAKQANRMADIIHAYLLEKLISPYGVHSKFEPNYIAPIVPDILIGTGAEGSNKYRLFHELFTEGKVKSHFYYIHPNQSSIFEQAINAGFLVPNPTIQELTTENKKQLKELGIQADMKQKVTYHIESGAFKDRTITVYISHCTLNGQPYERYILLDWTKEVGLGEQTTFIAFLFEQVRCTQIKPMLSNFHDEVGSHIRDTQELKDTQDAGLSCLLLSKMNEICSSPYDLPASQFVIQYGEDLYTLSDFANFVKMALQADYDSIDTRQSVSVTNSENKEVVLNLNELADMVYYQLKMHIEATTQMREQSLKITTQKSCPFILNVTYELAKAYSESIAN